MTSGIRRSLVVCALVGISPVLSAFAEAQALYEPAVIETAFCKRVNNNECHELFAHGSKVSISKLPLTSDGERMIHFWAKIRDPKHNIYALQTIREGNCYRESITIKWPSPTSPLWRAAEILMDHLKRADPPTVNAIANNLNLTKPMALSELNNPSASVRYTTTLPATGFRLYDARGILCPGRLTAVLAYANGKPAAGNNDPITIEITD